MRKDAKVQPRVEIRKAGTAAVVRGRLHTGRAFTKKYGVQKQMRFEPLTDIHVAIRREKSLRLWQRAWTINLIEHDNPHGQDLFLAMLDNHTSPTSHGVR